MRDDDVRSSCFASLDVLCARFGDDVPYRGGLDQGFPFRGARVPFLSTQKGIFRAAAQRGPAALSIQTSWKSPYGDAETETGYLYAYRAGAVDQCRRRGTHHPRRPPRPVEHVHAAIARSTRRRWPSRRCRPDRRRHRACDLP